jgi:nucleotide-binding universal stress UspA family protein
MKIMMYYDGTDHTKEALPVVASRAKAFDARVVVVSSLPKGDEAHLKEIEERENELDYIRGVFESRGIPCETHLLIKGNDATEDIALFAKEHKVDEIIIGTNKKSLFERFFTGIKAQQVINNARCPVVLT